MTIFLTILAAMMTPIIPMVEEPTLSVKSEARERAAKEVREWKTEQRRIASEKAAERRAVSYGGPWGALAASVGWSESELPTLRRIIEAESGGNPRAHNSSSGCAGLLQLHPCWYNGYWHFDPYDPRLNLLYGLKVKRMYGWSQWSTWSGT